MSDPVLDADVLTLRGIIAAAEERGRRRAEMERDELRACLDLARSFVSLQADRRPSEYNQELLTRINAALAPRDSDLPLCWKCGAPYKRPDVCDYCMAPRDSGRRRHRCMRCGDEFDCTMEGCVAKYDVLPTMIRGGVVVEHECKQREDRK